MLKFRADQSGAVALLFSLALPVLLATGGLAIDYASHSATRNSLQSAADSGALAGARELLIAGSGNQNVTLHAKQIAFNNISQNSSNSLNITSETDKKNFVSVKISVSTKTFFSFAGFQPPEISVFSRAEVGNTNKICILILSNQQSSAFHLKSNANVDASNCLVQSNSNHPTSIDTDSGIFMRAGLICAVGGIAANGRLEGEYVTGCPPIKDPVATRAQPSVPATCDHNKFSLDENTPPSTRKMIYPGVYCGGMFIGGNSRVDLSPGIYIIKDGQLKFDSNADIRGIGVSFFLTGNNSEINFTSNSKINFDASKDGLLAGILFFEDRRSKINQNHQITSNFATNLTGLIYLSRGRFIIDATNTVAEKSAFTVIIANEVLLTANPKLILNTNYHATSVPVPAAVSRNGNPRIVR